jgi:hypothetical protein
MNIYYFLYAFYIAKAERILKETLINSVFEMNIIFQENLNLIKVLCFKANSNKA